MMAIRNAILWQPLLCLLLLAALSGCGEDERNKPVQDETLATVANAEELTLYEGLPHQLYEAEDLKRELAEKQTVKLGGFPFYAEPLEWSEADQQKLQRIVASGRFAEPFLHEKECGGFHPDYAVQWTAAGQKYTLLVCFGCGEVKIFGSGEPVRYEIADDQIKNVLVKYRLQRPETKSSMVRSSLETKAADPHK